MAPRKVRIPEELPLTPPEREEFCARLLAWYRQHARDLPWRASVDPYRIWVSEIMLQQTRVEAVVEHYQRFLQRFPTLLSLALAPEDEVLALWSGLGYYRRARMLHKTAQFLLKEHDGTVPRTAAELSRLPGVGAYTSAAIASIAFGEAIAVVDGNVERVLLRIAGRPEQMGKQATDFVADFAQALIAPGKASGELPGDHNQAMMELGATVCLPRGPLCLQCPVHDLCRTRGEHSTLPRAAMRSERVAYAITTRKQEDGGNEILLHRRDAALSLMPGMLELPHLQSLPESQPLLRLRHAIVGTNYYAEIFTVAHRAEVENRSGTDELEWISLQEMDRAPLTGLARKVLQRVGLMKPDAELPEGGLTEVDRVNEESVGPVPLMTGRHGRVLQDMDE